MNPRPGRVPQKVTCLLTVHGQHSSLEPSLFRPCAPAHCGELTGETVAFAINDHSQIVGITSTANGQHAFLYDKGVLEDLNALIQQGLGWELTWAFDINNRGQIVGYGILNNRFRAFLLTPAISPHQCKDDDWQSFGFTNQGQCIQFVNTRE